MSTINQMSKEELLALLKQKDEQLAALTAGKSGKIQLKLNNSGYIDLLGLPDKGRFTESNSVAAWEIILGMTKEIREFVDKNKAEANQRLQNYKANRKVTALANVG